MNFLLVSTDFPPSSGGISTYTKELATALAKSHRVTVLAPGARKSAATDRSYPFRVARTPAVLIVRTLAFFTRIPLLIRRLHIDAVLHTVWPTALVSHFWRRLLPTPYFVSVYAAEFLDDTTTWRRRLKCCLRAWKQATLRNANCVFPVSHYSADLVALLGVDPDRIHVIPGGVDPKRFRPASDRRRENAAGKIVTVARLDLHKGHDRILEALAMLKKDGLTPSYTIVGKGDQEIRLRGMTRSLELEDQVIFAGFVPDSQIPQMYADADIFVMASREIPGRLDLIEGFGLVFLEASASGLPVVAGRSGGVSDAVRDGESGILVDPDEPKEVAEALKLLLTDKGLATRMGKEGRKWVEAEMTWQNVSEQLCDTVRKLV